MNSERFLWGLGLVTIGSLFLLENLGVFDLKWQFFAAAVFILMGIATLAEARKTVSEMSGENVVIPLNKATAADVKISYGAGTLMLEHNIDSEMLIVGQTRGGSQQEIEQRNNQLNVHLSGELSGCGTIIMPWNWFSDDRRWDLAFSPDVPLHLHLETGAGKNDFDFTYLNLKSLHLQTGASSNLIELPQSAGHTTAKVEAGACSLDIRIPKTAAARIQANHGLSDINIDVGRFPRKGDTYQSPDYNTNPNTIDLTLEIGASKVIID